ncbi:18047_t:CDS:2 [Entrophospora sp. SA101]|nr:18047_t:CDS:2 [Entrophospora sp. SA101]
MPSLDVQIQKLEKTLLSNEAYINYLEKEISNRDEGLGELEILRKNNMDLQKRLKKALLDTEYKEESLVILDSRISNLQQEIIDLKNRIQDITSRKKKLAMARAPIASVTPIEIFRILSRYDSGVSNGLNFSLSRAWMPIVIPPIFSSAYFESSQALKRAGGARIIL